VRFDVPQREHILAVQRANEVGDTTDDEVYVDLWPNGVNGFYYQFAANPIGTHWQYSSENTAYYRPGRRSALRTMAATRPRWRFR
jgi:hypothetical protein